MPRYARVLFLILSLFAMLLVSTADAVTKVYYVGGDKAVAKPAAAADGAKWVKNLTKAFAKAATDINAGGNVSVVIRMATGDYDGDLHCGAYGIPKFVNPKGNLLIQGGFADNFKTKGPFTAPSKIVTISDRSMPIWNFARNTKLNSFIVDGLLFDSGESNTYDARSNSLLIRGSSTHVFFKFNYLETNELAFENCVFMNSANRVMEPLIRAATPAAEIRYHNCMFINNRIPLKLDSARFRNKPDRIVVDHCSFLLNWAYNPDPNTGNPCALEIGPAEAANEIILTNNLFHCNFGGAILALNLRMPALTVNNNNFIGNGLLHGESDPDAVAMIVAAGGRKQPLSVDDIEDVPAVDEADNNVSIAAGIPLVLGEVQTVDVSKIKVANTWANEVRSILGMNLQGGTVAIKDYAPHKIYNPALPPFATQANAKRYGASPVEVSKTRAYRMASR
jgi:hypothetical protein